MIWLKEGFRLLFSSGTRAIVLVGAWLLLFSLACILSWAWNNSAKIKRFWQDQQVVELYLKPGVQPASMLALVDSLEIFEWDGVLNPEEASLEFESAFGLRVGELLGYNPFPITVLLRLKPEADEQRWVNARIVLAKQPRLAGFYADPLLFNQLAGKFRLLLFVLSSVFLLVLALNLLLLRSLYRSISRNWLPVRGVLILAGAPPLVQLLPLWLSLFIPIAVVSILVAVFWKVLFFLITNHTIILAP